jgi:hypothetical protein
MLHATFMQGNLNDSWLLMVGSQIDNLTLGSSFGHNLCFKCSNGSCKPTLDFYVPRAFQWYKKLLNPMGFDPCNHFLKIPESIWTPTPKMEVHLGVWVFILSHSLTILGAWNVPFGLPLLACTLASFCFGCEPKVRVVTNYANYDIWV